MAYAEITKVKDSDGGLINPAQDESVVLLRRMIKLMESQNATDIGNRQRFTLDAITAGLTLGITGTITAINNGLPTGTNNIGSVNASGADQRQFIDVSRTNYNTGIRSKLTFS